MVGMPYLQVGEYRQIGDGTTGALIPGQVGTALVQIHAVEIRSTGAADQTVCGLACGEPSQTGWEDPATNASGLQCPACKEKTGVF